MLVIQNPRLRLILRRVVPFALMPLAAAFSVVTGRYAIASLVCACFALLLFSAGFDTRRVGTRRMVLCVILTALSVAGRFIPIIKPVTCLTILAGMYLGAETGFLTGAMSALISNFYYGQGPWTPFQMLAWGLIGFLAGAAGKLLKRSAAAMYIYGFLSGGLFSLIMDVWSVTWYAEGFSARLYLASVLSALPFTLLYAVSNVVFLLLLAVPLGRKLDRIKLKYGV